MRNRVFWTRFFLAATLLTAALIFFFSAQQGPESAEMSSDITLRVAGVVKPDYEQLPVAQRRSFLEGLEHIVRKCAHFSEFALLGFNLMAWLALRRFNRPRTASAPWAWLGATLYAATDELHQMFVDARGPAILDVGIDSAGALAGVLAALLGMMAVQSIAARRDRVQE